MMNWEVTGIFRLWPNWKYDPAVRVERLRKIMGNLSLGVLTEIRTWRFMNTGQQCDRLSQLAGWPHCRTGAGE